MSVIIVEGIDGAGKSTLVSCLANVKPNALLLQSITPPTSIASFYSTVRNWDQMALKYRDVICDRHPLISEYVYGDTVIETEIRLNAFDVLKYLVSLNVSLIVYCKADLGKLLIEPRKNDKRDVEFTEFVKRRLDIIDARYTAIMLHLKKHFLVREVNVLESNPVELAESIYKDLENSDHQSTDRSDDD